MNWSNDPQLHGKARAAEGVCDDTSHEAYGREIEVLVAGFTWGLSAGSAGGQPCFLWGCDPDVIQCSLTNLKDDVFTVWGVD